MPDAYIGAPSEQLPKNYITWHFLTRDSNGHVVKVNTKTVTLPSGGDGAAGEDGGYYTPSVSSAGVLSWSASKSGMAAVSSTDLGALIQSYVEDAILGGVY